jgi:hypothetical protein
MTTETATTANPAATITETNARCRQAEKLAQTWVAFATAHGSLAPTVGNARRNLLTVDRGRTCRKGPVVTVIVHRLYLPTFKKYTYKVRVVDDVIQSVH